ncbi:MAG TPA: hypothetical protein VK979_05320 [Guyparkeria sp.]|nr:hypothetical protein [Guyparkeria sp.]
MKKKNPARANQTAQARDRRRQELRDMGYKPTEIWLHQDQLAEVDRVAKSERISRSKAVEELLAAGLKHRK